MLGIFSGIFAVQFALANGFGANEIFWSWVAGITGGAFVWAAFLEIVRNSATAKVVFAFTVLVFVNYAKSEDPKAAPQPTSIVALAK